MKGKKIVERLVKFSEANDEWDIKFWQEAGVNMIFSATWKMIEEYYKMKGITEKNGNKFRLQRSIQHIKKT